MRVFVATRVQDVPPGLRHYASVDGVVPGAAVTWDHHTTGEPINLDAMPDVIDPTRFDGVGTTMADTDALVSALAVQFGGVSKLPRLDVLRSACWSCDHLKPAPGASAQVAALGAGLHRYVSHGLRTGGRDAFSALTQALHDVLANDEPLPFAAQEPSASRPLRDTFPVTERGPVALVELAQGQTLDPARIYRELRCTLAVVLAVHSDGGRRYTVGLHPAARGDLRPLLHTLAGMEHAHGPPCLGPLPIPEHQNWGGRATVFGSPWNHGSRLPAQQVLQVCARFVDEGSVRFE